MQPRIYHLIRESQQPQWTTAQTNTDSEVRDDEGILGVREESGKLSQHEVISSNSNGTPVTGPPDHEGPGGGELNNQGMEHADNSNGKPWDPGTLVTQQP